MNSRILYLVGACAAMTATSCTPGQATPGLAANSTTPAVAADGPVAETTTGVEGETNVEKAMFGAGCFWGVEAAFRKVDGVVSTAVGYSGGTLDNPTYKDVCGDGTGHAEVIEVQYDPSKVTYDQLLDVFWGIHDPTTLNRQGPDVGTQYRSAIYYYTPEQKAAAEASKAKLADSGKYKQPIVTEITPASVFWRAEEYHQCYLEKRGAPSCGSH